MKKRLLSTLLALCMALALLPAAAAAGSGSAGYSQSGSTAMAKLTKQEIAKLVEITELSNPTQIYSTEPGLSAPYSAGSLRQDVLQAGLDRLNALRRIAGLPDVSLDSSYTASTQAAALVNAVNKVLSHSPTQPSDMSSTLYNQGAAGARSSNIASYYGHRPADGPIAFSVDIWMDDSDASNVSLLGHRRWQLNPTMSKTGFGAVYAANTYNTLYSAEYAHDRSGSGTDYDFIAWPSSGNFPAVDRLFHGNTAWSVTLNPNKYQTPSKSGLTVTLTRESDGYRWTFLGSENYTAAGSGKYFNVDTGGYGVSNCIIFRPDGVKQYRGVYTVTITGLKTRSGAAATLSYQVDFFDPNDRASFEPASGTCGDNLTWALNNGVLTIKGTGAMDNFGTYGGLDMPWYKHISLYGEELRTIMIDSGVTTIGNYAFYLSGLSDNLTGVTIPASVTSIGVSAFAGCNSLTDVYYGGSKSQWNAISIGDDNAPLLNAKIHCAVTEPDPETPTPSVPNFTDVPAGQYYTDAVAWAVKKGITTGKTTTAFEPETPCTRAQIVTFLWRAYNMPEPSITVNPFTDVKPGDYYYKAVLWAYEKGITTGAVGTLFDPDGECTRAQAVTFLWRAADRPVVTGSSSFTDVSAGQYYTDAVAWAVEKGITTGKTTTAFEPNTTCTRGQIVTFLYRQLG